MTTHYTPTTERYNVLAIVGFITSFFISVVGVVLGFIALSQIKRTGEKGRGLALAAVIIGFVTVIIYAVIIVAVLAIAATAPHRGW
ncbi:DUF4190 domain-containing protein [Rathayibacter iranicus]|uniref:DUF4190 domain-containing protein n=2 Tax=Rathayibacter iranicus TaxID=59737 RepID=A0AAD1EMZ2_9MICO|nr:DUF4190 domain-containing protein [Rathayibacter iranicus]AZZ56024.1 DUF4190 domain-containing protein [Rathayibacter iranicus]MWV30290.1 DUF4190 domain-containing protein [Rathayibacter iranicus NCPPB 2253 = VKM Ac-1602]PPI46486.1 DUF4190 domain-containing protein [Rathayibacter iranicus]PPI59901.1 DUF4190 domain-containing protein [Rathayibacter iranicus]PPI71566.1 DUF4190 domain-containing protein [Rathayibacter iranicus]